MPYALRQMLIRGAAAVMLALLLYGLFVLSLMYAGHAMAQQITNITARGQAYTDAHTKHKH